MSKPSTVDASEQWPLPQLQEEADAIRTRLNRFREALGRFFVAKQHLVDAMVIAAVAGEPLLLVGPPGTAKSDLVLKFRDALGVEQSDYFEYMLTRFTEPSEIIGPIDINELRGGRFIRREQGKLPTARLAFLDEIFKSNSAILNILLTIINERKFYQDGVPQPVRLRILFAASNDVPEQEELAALKDRFPLKAASDPVLESHFDELIEYGLQAEAHRGLGQKPWCEGLATLEDVLKANRYLTYQFGGSGKANGDTDRARFFPEPVFREFRRVVQTLSREDRIFISDRKLVKVYKLLRVRAWLLRGGTVALDDLRLLAFIGDTMQQIRLLAEKIPLLLDLASD